MLRYPTTPSPNCPKVNFFGCDLITTNKYITLVGIPGLTIRIPTSCFQLLFKARSARSKIAERSLARKYGAAVPTHAPVRSAPVPVQTIGQITGWTPLKIKNLAATLSNDFGYFKDGEKLVKNLAG